MVDIVITVQAVGEGYHNIAERQVVFRGMAGHRDIHGVSYNAGSVVADMLNMLANELNPEAPKEADADDAAVGL